MPTITVFEDANIIALRAMLSIALSESNVCSTTTCTPCFTTGLMPFIESIPSIMPSSFLIISSLTLSTAASCFSVSDELVSEHQIMQQAYAQANEVVMIATKQAQEILDNATNDANNIRMGAMQYTDDILRNLENTISHSMDAAKARHDAYVSSLQGFLDVVTANRAELNPTAEEPETKTTDAQASQADGPKVEISSDMLG